MASISKVGTGGKCDGNRIQDKTRPASRAATSMREGLQSAPLSQIRGTDQPTWALAHKQTFLVQSAPEIVGPAQDVREQRCVGNACRDHDDRRPPARQRDVGEGSAQGDGTAGFCDETERRNESRDGHSRAVIGDGDSLRAVLTVHREGQSPRAGREPCIADGPPCARVAQQGTRGKTAQGVVEAFWSDREEFGAGCYFSESDGTSCGKSSA